MEQPPTIVASTQRASMPSECATSVGRYGLSPLLATPSTSAGVRPQSASARRAASVASPSDDSATVPISAVSAAPTIATPATRASCRPRPEHRQRRPHRTTRTSPRPGGRAAARSGSGATSTRLLSRRGPSSSSTTAITYGASKPGAGPVRDHVAVQRPATRGPHDLDVVARAARDRTAAAGSRSRDRRGSAGAAARRARCRPRSAASRASAPAAVERSVAWSSGRRSWQPDALDVDLGVPLERAPRNARCPLTPNCPGGRILAAVSPRPLGRRRCTLQRSCGPQCGGTGDKPNC